MAMEMDAKQKSMLTTIKNIYRKEGIRAFYNGIVPSLTGIVPYHGTGFFMYHLLKGKLRETYPQWKQSKAFDFIFGAIAGLVAQLGKYKVIYMK